jgi:TRAP-type C4-dicarboxylate transport system permease small subunit
VKAIKLLSQALEASQIWIANVLLCFMVLAIGIEVTSRYVLGHSYAQLEELATLALVWMTFLVIGAVHRRGEHILVDFLPNRLGAKGGVTIAIISEILVVAFFSFVFWSSIKSIMFHKELGDIEFTALEDPVWIVQLVIPIACLLMIFASTERVLKRIVSLRAK